MAQDSDNEFGTPLSSEAVSGTVLQQNKTPLDAEDDFGLSSSDEADLLKLPENTVSKFKRKSEEPDSGHTKKVRLSANIDTATRILQDRFGKESFRLKQEAAITRLLDGNSAVIVMPTGGGKSLCYQVPALCFKELDRLSGTRQGRAEGGITLIVSPLIALMKDQVDALHRRGISAAVMNSTKTVEEHRATVRSMQDGTLDILYCAPERLNNEGFVGSMARVKGGVRMLAVDEAHCISEWGHAFRPDYLKIARFAKEIQAERVVCLTATATPKVATDVCHAFNIPEKDGLFRTSSYRPNLRLQAESYSTKSDSYPNLRAFLRAHPGPTIIYVTTQKQAESLAKKLRNESFNARHYHADISIEEKTVCQDRFMSSKDLIIVATIAFGMGIDKANIRNVIHYDIPRSLEGYSQEIGRAGRDGLESHCMMYLCAEDLHLRESFARGDLPSKTSVTALIKEICSSPQVVTPNGLVIEVSLYEQANATDIKVNVLTGIYAQLELHFGLIRASTPKYSSYSYEPMQVHRLADDKSTESLAIQNTGKKSVKLTHVDVDEVSRLSGLSRSAIVSKLNSWHDSKVIDLRSKGVVNVFRVLKPLPSTPAQKQAVVDALYKQLEVREQQDLQRMEQVIDLVTGKECFTRILAAHFGDALPDRREECGHCTWCETKVAVPKVEPFVAPWNSKAFAAILQKIPERDDPRFLARVAFGISSPRVRKEKLNPPTFGSMEDHDFMALFKAFSKVCGK